MSPRAPMTVAVGPLVSSNSEDGLRRWRLTDLAGWHASAVRTSVQDRPQSDIAFTPGRSLRSAKIMQWQGVVEAESAEAAEEECWDAINGLSPDGEDIPLVVTTSAGVRTMQVRLQGNIEVKPFAPTKARFNVSLVAIDPRKLSYPRAVTTGLGVAAVSGSGLVFPLGNAAGFLDFGSGSQPALVTVTNAGKAPTYPVFRVTGGFDLGYEIVATGTSAVRRFLAPVALTEVIVDDTATNRVLSDGINDRTTNLVRADSMAVRGGESKTFLFRALGTTYGTPQLTATIKDAWW